MHVHPLCDGVENADGAGIHSAAAVGADVEQHVAAGGHAVDQRAQDHFRAFPVAVLAVVGPGVRQREAGLPRHRLLALGRRLVLLAGPEVGVPVGTIVDQDARRQFAHQGAKGGRIPIIAPLADPMVSRPAGDLRLVRVRIGEVEPHDVDLAVPGQQFAHVAEHVLPIERHVARLGTELGVIAHRMQEIERELRVVPVEQRIVEPDLETVPPAGLDIGADQIPPGRRVGRLVVGQPGVPQAEPVMVLGGQHRIFHAGPLGRRDPGVRVVEVGLEMVDVFLIIGIEDRVPVTRPGHLARMQRAGTPMDEHAEAVPGEPTGVARGHVRSPVVIASPVAGSK